MRMSFRYRFEAAHRLMSAASPMCQTPHGHTWHATLSFEAKTDSLNGENMLAEFQKVKGPWKSFVRDTLDHSFFYNSKDPILESLKENIPSFRGLPTPGDPTTEMLAVLFLSKALQFSKNQNTPVSPVSIEVQETEVNSVSTDVNSDLFKNTLQNLSAGGWWSTGVIEDRQLNSQM